MTCPALTCVRRGAAWWIISYEEPVGPYETKREAEDDRRGLLRFERYGEKPGFVTTEAKQ